MRDYGKIFYSFWQSDDTRGLSDDGKLLAIYLLTSPHTNMIGCFRIPDGYVSEDLGWDIGRVSKGFEELFQNRFATRDQGSKWVVINKFLKWNELENPNQAKAAEKLYDQIPTNNPVKPILSIALSEYAPRFNQEKLKPFLNPSGTLSKPGTGTETGSGTGTGTERKEGDADPPPASPPLCPHQAIISLFHEVLPGLPRVVKWTDTRQEHLRKCWRDETRQSLEWWKEYFVRVRGTPFLLGENDRNWQADLEWLTTESNLLKVLEGKYSGIGNRSGTTRQGASPALAHAGRAQSDGAPWPEFTVYGPD